MKLFGDDLRERRADVLADLGLAGVDGDLAVFADVQPGGDVPGNGLAAAAAAAAAAGLLLGTARDSAGEGRGYRRPATSRIRGGPASNR